MRSNGFYWVKFNGTWGVAMWHESMWRVPWREYPFDDDDFEKINEQPIPPPKD